MHGQLQGLTEQAHQCWCAYSAPQKPAAPSCFGKRLTCTACTVGTAPRPAAHADCLDEHHHHCGNCAAEHRHGWGRQIPVDPGSIRLTAHEQSPSPAAVHSHWPVALTDWDHDLAAKGDGAPPADGTGREAYGGGGGRRMLSCRVLPSTSRTCTALHAPPPAHSTARSRGTHPPTHLSSRCPEGQSGDLREGCTASKCSSPCRVGLRRGRACVKLRGSEQCQLVCTQSSLSSAAWWRASSAGTAPKVPGQSYPMPTIRQTSVPTAFSHQNLLHNSRRKSEVKQERGQTGKF